MFKTLTKQPISLDKDRTDEVFVQSYDELAGRLGVAARAKVVISKLQSVLMEESIHVYDLAHVEKYMDGKGYWGWFPLRPIDVKFSVLIGRVTPTNYATLYGVTETEVYPKAVPYPVLLTVDKILQRCDSAYFFVAAPQTHPDPFLGVLSAQNSGLFVIERWDEPSFR